MHHTMIGLALVAVSGTAAAMAPPAKPSAQSEREKMDEATRLLKEAQALLHQDLEKEMNRAWLPGATPEPEKYEKARALFERFHDMITSDPATPPADLGKLSVLAGVREFPTRIKCASLAWHTMKAAVADNRDAPVSTE